MANVRIRLTGRKAVTAATHNAVFTRFLEIATENALEISDGGFVIQSWDDVAGRSEPTEVVFTWEKTVPEAQVQAVWNSFSTIAAAEPFIRALFQVTPAA
jgi:hypothetical protein